MYSVVKIFRFLRHILRARFLKAWSQSPIYNHCQMFYHIKDSHLIRFGGIFIIFIFSIHSYYNNIYRYVMNIMSKILTKYQNYRKVGKLKNNLL